MLGLGESVSPSLSLGSRNELRQQLEFAWRWTLLRALGDDTIATSTGTVLDHDYVFARSFIEGL